MGNTCSLCGDLKDYESADYLLGKELSPAAEKFFDAHRINKGMYVYHQIISCRECGQDYELDIDTEQLTWDVELRRVRM